MEPEILLTNSKLQDWQRQIILNEVARRDGKLLTRHELLKLCKNNNKVKIGGQSVSCIVFDENFIN